MHIRINMIKVYIFGQFKFRGIKTQLENKTIVWRTWFLFKNENKEYNRYIAFNRGHRYLLILLFYVYRGNSRGNFFTFYFIFIFILRSRPRLLPIVAATVYYNRNLNNVFRTTYTRKKTSLPHAVTDILYIAAPDNGGGGGQPKVFLSYSVRFSELSSGDGENFRTITPN